MVYVPRQWYRYCEVQSFHKRLRRWRWLLGLPISIEEFCNTSSWAEGMGSKSQHLTSGSLQWVPRASKHKWRCFDFGLENEFLHAESVSEKNPNSDDHFDRCFSPYPNGR